MKNKLTAKEYEVMTVLWQGGEPMLASAILEKTKTVSSNSIHHLLNSLVEKGYVRVAGTIIVVKVASKLYLPAVSAAEYGAMQLSEIFKLTAKGSLRSILMCFIKRNKSKNAEIMAELREFLDEYDAKTKNDQD